MMAIFEYLLLVLKQFLYVFALGILPYLIFALIMQWFSNAIRMRMVAFMGVKGYVYLTAPGVVIHELSHAFFCLLFGHKIVEMKLFSPSENGVLGYVNHCYNPNNYYQRIGNFFIGTGPVWGGVFVLYLISIILLPEGMLVLDQGIYGMFSSFMNGLFSWNFISRWQSWLYLYLLLTVASHVTLSLADLKGALEGFIVLLGGILIFELCLAWSAEIRKTVHYILERAFACSSVLLASVLMITLTFTLLLQVMIRKK